MIKRMDGDDNRRTKASSSEQLLNRIHRQEHPRAEALALHDLKAVSGVKGPDGFVEAIDDDGIGFEHGTDVPEVFERLHKGDFPQSLPLAPGMNGHLPVEEDRYRVVRQPFLVVGWQCFSLYRTGRDRIKGADRVLFI